ncbi:hypothetical protein H9651_11455 [Microbacterium sp. Sa4CUA7]|uniref:Uncharacterized protein n=1 Tax=Microbacterium pullorum TaxID=2762236 RepID=A0ABR8S461_9MICO|nr:hypothetical protein [Microbacterium pullorum]MBD7958258.1 hypothetical protein [Microbacterium pullorum]
MSRISERSTWLSWAVGIVSVGVVAGLIWLALPGLPAVVGLAGDTLRGPQTTQADAAETGTPAECRRLYTDALWAGLSWTPGSQLAQDDSTPPTSATVLVDSLAPEVRFTCTWTSESGTIVTTLADVGSDAGAIAQAALPELGFGCGLVADTRVRCTRSAEEVLETLEFADGLWLSTVETTWHPERYASRVAEAVWNG